MRIGVTLSMAAASARVISTSPGGAVSDVRMKLVRSGRSGSFGENPRAQALLSFAEANRLSSFSENIAMAHFPRTRLPFGPMGFSIS